jgi:hypothetical protein
MNPPAPRAARQPDRTRMPGLVSPVEAPEGCPMSPADGGLD